eukprot:g7800.t1
MPLGVEHICREVLKQARFGLFHGVPLRHGYQVSKKGKNKTKRVWKPNIQTVSLYSETLNRKFRLDVTTTALRRIDYEGGLDNYLIYTPARIVGSDIGAKIRDEIIAKRERQGRPVDLDLKAKAKSERFYIEKILKPKGRVTYEMVSDQTGKRLDVKTKREINSSSSRSPSIKVIPPPKPVDMEALRQKYLN